MGGGASKDDFVVRVGESDALAAQRQGIEVEAGSNVRDSGNHEAYKSKQSETQHKSIWADKSFRKKALCGWTCFFITVLLLSILIPRIPTTYVDRAKALETIEFEDLGGDVYRIFGPLEVEITNRNFYCIEDMNVVTTTLDEIESSTEIAFLRMDSRSTTTFTLLLNQTVTASLSLAAKAVKECLDNSMPVAMKGSAKVRVPGIQMSLNFDDTFETFTGSPLPVERRLNYQAYSGDWFVVARSPNHPGKRGSGQAVAGCRNFGDKHNFKETWSFDFNTKRYFIKQTSIRTSTVPAQITPRTLDSHFFTTEGETEFLGSEMAMIIYWGTPYQRFMQKSTGLGGEKHILFGLGPLNADLKYDWSLVSNYDGEWILVYGRVPWTTAARAVNPVLKYISDIGDICTAQGLPCADAVFDEFDNLPPTTAPVAFGR